MNKENVPLAIDGDATRGAKVTRELDELPAAGDLKRELGLKIAGSGEGQGFL